MISLKKAQTIVKAALGEARAKEMKPLVVVVYDERGALKALAAEDGTSLKRAEIACGKAYGVLALGIGGRSVAKMAIDRPHFVAAVSHVVGGTLIPVPGGVLIRDAKGVLQGSVGVSGDTSDNDEIAALAGIAAAGLVAEIGTA